MPVFIKYDGVDGEATAVGFERWHELFSFSWGESNAGSSTPGSGGGGGGGAGKVIMSDFAVHQRSGRGSPHLMFLCAKGQHVASAQMVFTLNTGTGSPQIFQRWTMSNVRITSYQTSGADGDRPTESLSLNFEKVKFEQAVVAADGSVRFQEATWDQRLNTGAFIP